MEVDGEFMRLYEEAKELVGHAPAREIFRRALHEFVSKRKVIIRNPEPHKAKSSRFIPKSVRVEVFRRDNSQCTFVGKSGKRCSERHGLEVDHIMPYGIGGSNGVNNLRLLCRAHNRLAAERVFGREKFISRSSEPSV